MDSAFLQGVKKIFGFGDPQKKLVDPYFLMNFAGKEVSYIYNHKEEQHLKATTKEMSGENYFYKSDDLF